MAELFDSTYKMIDKQTVGNANTFNLITQSLDKRLNELEIRTLIGNIFIPGVVSAGVKVRFPMPFNARNIIVALGVVTAPAGGDLIVDINKAGVTIFNTQANRPTVPDGLTSGVFSIAGDITPIINTPTQDVLEIEVDSIGGGAPAGLSVIILGEKIAQ